jgi:hypothetical protein
MKKRKNKLRKKINPEKSNKMIWAVSGGLLILLIVLLLFTLGGSHSSDTLSVMKNTLSYIRKTEGIKDLVFLPDISTVKILFDPDPNSRNRIDYEKLAVFAGIKLSHKLKGNEITILLVRTKSGETVLSVRFRGGRLIKN